MLRSRNHSDYAARPAISCSKPSIHLQNCRQHVHCTVTLTDKNAADTFEITVATFFYFQGQCMLSNGISTFQSVPPALFIFVNCGIQ